jgi:ketosteroid isomerase-like protein
MGQFVAEEMEWLEVEGVPDVEGAERRGREEVLSSLESLFETWQQYRLEPREVRAIGDHRVLALVREVARGRASGIEVSGNWGYVMTIRDGKLARVEAYRDPAKALEAAGLSP